MCLVEARNGKQTTTTATTIQRLRALFEHLGGDELVGKTRLARLLGNVPSAGKF